MKIQFENLCNEVSKNAKLKDLNRVWHYVVKNRGDFTTNQIDFLIERLDEIGAKIVNNKVIRKKDEFDLLMIKIADCRKDLSKLNECYDYAICIEEDFTDKERLYLGDMFYYCYQDIIDREQKEYEQLKKDFKMQHSNKEYNATLHERKKALTVKNPYAEWIARGEKKIEVRSRDTKHRGELVICSSQKPLIQEMQSGCILATVNLWKTKPFKELTEEERLSTKIPREQWKDLESHYGWFLKDVVRLIEFPVKGQLGIFNLVMDKLEFMPYNSNENIDFINDKKKPQYDRKAVALGCLFITIIFAIVVLVVWGLFRAFS